MLADRNLEYLSFEKVCQQQIKTDSETHSQTSVGVWGVLCKHRGKIELEKTWTSQEDLQSLGLWEFTETEPPTTEYARAEPSSLSTLVADMHLGLHVGLLTTGVRAVSDSAACY